MTKYDTIVSSHCAISRHIVTIITSQSQYSDIHIKLVTDQHLMHCEWKSCTFVADTEELLYHHAISQHTEHGIKPVCQWNGCEYTTSNRYRLKTHLKSHFSVKAHECQVCGLQYKHRYNLSRHIRASHPQSSQSISITRNGYSTESDFESTFGSPSSAKWQEAMHILFGTQVSSSNTY